MKRLLVAAALLALLAAPALAEPNPAFGLTEGASTRRNLSTANVTSINAQGGNVTRLDINGISVTQSWAGYYGNITGNIVLQSANNDSFYEWGNATSVTGEIFASRNDSVQWSTINCSNATHIAAEETALGHVASDADSVTNTFNETDHPSFLVGARNMTGCPSTNVYVNGAAQNADYDQVFLADGNDNTVYTTIIENGATGFDGNSWDFQLLVGENEHSGSEGTTTYYFYTELG